MIWRRRTKKFVKMHYCEFDKYNGNWGVYLKNKQGEIIAHRVFSKATEKFKYIKINHD